MNTQSKNHTQNNYYCPVGDSKLNTWLLFHNCKLAKQSIRNVNKYLIHLQMLVGDINSRSSPNVMSQSQSSEMSTPEKVQCPDNGKFIAVQKLSLKFVSKMIKYIKTSRTW